MTSIQGSTERTAQKVKEKTTQAMERARRLREPTGPRKGHALFGRLPLRGLVPQDVHSVVDWATAVNAAAPAFYAESRAARIASVVFGFNGTVFSALTDCHLSLAKVIPIEVHQARDYVFGMAQIAAPFVFRYFKRSRAAAIAHITGGATLIALSLVTDYRAHKGVGGRAFAGV